LRSFTFETGEALSSPFRDNAFQYFSAFSFIPPVNGNLIAIAEREAYTVAVDLFGDDLVKIKHVAV
jgi:hypothetical protein